MTQRQENTGTQIILEIINEHGLDGLAEAISILINEAMKAERSEVLKAKPWERSESRQGYANGFKAKHVDSRLGKLSLNVPQVRGDVSFHPSALEKGIRSERALKLAIAVIMLNENHLRRILRSYFDYYHEDRTHLGLGKETPSGRDTQSRPEKGIVISLSRVGGLHHRYEWKDAA